MSIRTICVHTNRVSATVHMPMTKGLNPEVVAANIDGGKKSYVSTFKCFKSKNKKNNGGKTQVCENIGENVDKNLTKINKLQNTPNNFEGGKIAKYISEWEKLYSRCLDLEYSKRL